MSAVAPRPRTTFTYNAEGNRCALWVLAKEPVVRRELGQPLPPVHPVEVARRAAIQARLERERARALHT
jgi:hypothetical protein